MLGCDRDNSSILLSERSLSAPKKASAGGRTSTNADDSHQAACNAFTPIAEEEIRAAGGAQPRLENLHGWHSGLS
jgi:hypothetical protein